MLVHGRDQSKLQIYMSKFQNIRFESINDLLNFLPEHELVIVQFLRKLVFDCFPNPIEKISYNVPYYYQHSRVCFIWPSSVPWGNVKKDGVLLGFCHGNLLRDEMNFLEKGDRKQVFVKTFQKIKDIDTDIVKTYIIEAIFIDEQIRKNKKLGA